MPLRRKTKRRAAKSKSRPLKRAITASFVVADFLTKVGDGRAVVKYRNKQKIFSQGDPADAVFFIQRGRVKITVVSEHGKEAVVAILDKGEFCGEGCLSGQALRIATARAMADCEITRIERNILIRTLHDEASLSALFLEYMLKRTIRVEADLVDQLFNSSEKRLARALLMLANFGKDDRSDPVVSKISQETLAEMIGTTRSRVSFFMNKFRKLGFVTYSGGASGTEGAPGMKIHGSLLSVVLSELPPHIKRDVEGSREN